MEGLTIAYICISVGLVILAGLMSGNARTMHFDCIVKSARALQDAMDRL